MSKGDIIRKFCVANGLNYTEIKSSTNPVYNKIARYDVEDYRGQVDWTDTIKDSDCDCGHKYTSNPNHHSDWCCVARAKALRKE